MKITHISQFDHLRDVKQIKFKDEMVNDQKVTIVNYMVATNDLWQIPAAIECRGITFDANGEIVCRPFEKFFNLNEKEWTQVNVLPWDQPYVVTEKLDGSMITPVLVGGEVCVKTKKSFYSDVALTAREYLNQQGALWEFCYQQLVQGRTPIFEFLHPSHKVVLNYNKPRMVLLAIRDIKTGMYLCLHDVDGVDKVRVIEDNQLDTMLSDMRKLTDFEGYVVSFPHSKVKIKTDWYTSMHHMVTDVRYRDIADAVVDEVFDDLVAKAVDMRLDVGVFNRVQQQVVEQLYEMKEYAEKIATDCQARGMSAKDVASAYAQDWLFSAIMSEFRGKEFDYVKMWCGKYRSEYSLASVYNESFGP